LFIVSALTPMTVGYNIRASLETEPQLTSVNNDGLSYSSWPVHKHDPQRTGRSPYDTSNNHGGIKWKYLFDMGAQFNSAVIDRNGTVYISNYWDLIAVDKNGTGKWIVDTGDYKGGTPAVGPDGTIYIGTIDHLFAYNPDGTKKWTLENEHNFFGNPTVGPDGTVYATTNDGYLYAVNPNGTVKWRFIDKNEGCSDAAVDHNGNIYYGTIYSNNLYCINPNGTENWRYRTVHGFDYCPVIGDDGTIYAKDISYLVALNPDGTEKWKQYIWGDNPSLAPDGKIILGGTSEFITARSPETGGIRWRYEIPNIQVFIDSVTETVIGGDGTIYFAYTYDKRFGFVCVLSPEGDLLWETHLTSDIQPVKFFYILSEPSIGDDGTVYITTEFSYQGPNSSEDFGYLYAINKQNPSPAPGKVTINGETKGTVGIEYNYTFKSASPAGEDVYYLIDWGDYTYERWIGPYPSDEEITVGHIWDEADSYVIKARAKSADDMCGPWETFEVTMQRNKAINSNSLLIKSLAKFPLLERLVFLIK